MKASYSTKIDGLLGDIPVGDKHPVRVMGVINLSSNSFYSGSVKNGPDEIVRSAVAMEEEGADVIDVGARSTAPYRSYDISVESEKRLLTQAVRLVVGKVRIPISADTTRMEPAKAAIREGATILNDAYGLTQRDAGDLALLAAETKCSLIVTAHEARPLSGGSPVGRVMNALKRATKLASSLGVERRRIISDPGIGFFSDKKMSNVEWNCSVIALLARLRALSYPICVGASRKRFIGMISGGDEASDRLGGSLAAAAIAVYNGCHVVRTHDVPETVQAVKVATEIKARERV